MFYPKKLKIGFKVYAIYRISFLPLSYTVLFGVPRSFETAKLRKTPCHSVFKIKYQQEIHIFKYLLMSINLKN